MISAFMYKSTTPIKMLHLLEIILTILATCGTLAIAQDRECAEDWHEITRPGARTMRCARYIKNRVPYDEAAAWCQNRANVPGRRGKLAQIFDEETQKRLEIGMMQNAGGLFPGWIGLRMSNELNEDNERFWQWGGEDGATLGEFGYRNWAPFTPNNSPVAGGQDCVYMNDYRKAGSWNDFECNTFLNFICQYDNV